MQTPQPTLILMVLDESGSMGPKRADVIGGFNAFVMEQMRDPAPCRISLIKFNTQHTRVYDARPLVEVPRLDGRGYCPGGNTALYDAVAEAVRIADHQRKPEDRVLCVIITDGEENSSRETTKEQVKQIISTRQTQQGWTFVYLGANPEAWVSDMGIRPGNSATYFACNPAASFQSLSEATSGYRRKQKESSDEFWSSENSS